MLRGPSTSGGPWARYAPGMNFHLDATTVDVLSRWFFFGIRYLRFKSDSPVPAGEQKRNLCLQGHFLTLTVDPAAEGRIEREGLGGDGRTRS